MASRHTPPAAIREDSRAAEMLRSAPSSKPRTQLPDILISRRVEIALVALAVLATGCWLFIYRWYSVFDHASEPFFAFEKLPGRFDSPALRWTELLFLTISAIYACGYWAIRSAAHISPVIKLAVIALIVGPATINVVLYPVGALDVFNYMVELRLAYHYDQNPYLVTISQYPADPFAEYAFLKRVPLFYGPVWLLMSGLPVLVVGLDDVIQLLLALKVFNLLVLAVTALMIAAYQSSEKRRWLAFYAFLANPLVLFEGVANAHNDVLMTGFLVASVLALQRGSALAVPLLIASVLVKFFTVVALPLVGLYLIINRWGWRKMAVSGVVSLAVVIVAFAPFWDGMATIDGLRDGIRLSQDMEHVSPFSLAQQYVERRNGEDAVPAVRQVATIVFLAFALVVGWRMARGRHIVASMVAMLLLFSLLLTNLYSWYLIPIVALLALRRDAPGTAYLFVATTLGLAYYPLYVYAHFNTEWSRLQVHLFLSLFLTVPMVIYLVVDTRWSSRQNPPRHQRADAATVVTVE